MPRGYIFPEFRARGPETNSDKLRKTSKNADTQLGRGGGGNGGFEAKNNASELKSAKNAPKKAGCSALNDPNS